LDVSLINVINTIACGNLVLDMVAVDIAQGTSDVSAVLAQGTTCDVSNPVDIDGLRINLSMSLSRRFGRRRVCYGSSWTLLPGRTLQ
jgi:hypothetical protein